MSDSPYKTKSMVDVIPIFFLEPMMADINLNFIYAYILYNNQSPLAALYMLLLLKQSKI